MQGHAVERLDAAELELVKPLLVDLQLHEQTHYPDHPQQSRAEIEADLPPVRSHFRGENVVLAVRESPNRPDRLAGFCWIVLFDPGTGLEGELAELYVAEGHRHTGVGEALVRAAVEVFKERGVTLGYVWTRGENEPAVRLYQGAGFEPSRQLVLTWYPID